MDDMVVVVEHMGGKRNKICTLARLARSGARFVYLAFLVLLKSLNPCTVGHVRVNSTSFFGLEVCMWAFADVLADLASKAAIILHRTGFSCADLLPEN